LRGREVAITGRLFALSRAEAIARLAEAQARYVARVGERTAVLVVGQAGPPLGRDGRLTANLRQALALQEAGSALRIVSEETLLDLLSLGDERSKLQRFYTTSQLSRVLAVPPSRLRAWIRYGLIRPAHVRHRLLFFDFRQVASAKALTALTRSGVQAARIARSLNQLGVWYGAGEQALMQLELLDGGSLAVRLESGRRVEPDGQMQLFDEHEQEDCSATASLQRFAPEARRTWFERGVRAEEAGHLDEAVDAYRRALEIGELESETLFNLGNALYAQGELAEAVECLRGATRLDPDYAEAWNNLGNALAECGRLEEALSAFRRALLCEPEYADAHYNLAETLAQSGSPEEAVRHWEAYLRLDPSSTWAEVVRQRLYPRAARPSPTEPEPHRSDPERR
jgi:tetratricopeptide (TPR) repeat protein